MQFLHHMIWGERGVCLSGGQKRVAPGVLLNPRVLLCDEATSALTPRRAPCAAGDREVDERANGCNHRTPTVDCEECESYCRRRYRCGVCRCHAELLELIACIATPQRQLTGTGASEQDAARKVS